MGVAAWLRKLAAGPYDLMRGVLPVTQGEPPVRGTRELVEGYDTVPWLRACAEHTSSAVACAGVELYALTAAGKAVREPAVQRARMDIRRRVVADHRRRGTLRQITQHPFLDMLHRPNPAMGCTSLLKIANTHCDLVGDAFWIKERNGLGTWVGSWPVPPDWVEETPASGRPSFRISYRTWRVEVPERDVFWLHEPSPSNPYTRGSGVGWSLGDEFEVDEYAAKMAKQLFFNRARPDFVVMGGAGSSEDEMRALERNWLNRLQGFWRAHRPYFLSGEVKIHEFQQPTVEQLVYPGLRKAERDIVIQVWGIPPEMFGISERGLLARTNYEGAEYMFSKYVVQPRVERLRDALQRAVEMEYDDRLIVDSAYTIPADKQFLLAVRKAAPHAWRVDEWRALGDSEPLGGAEGNALLVPLNSTLTDDPLKEPPPSSPGPDDEKAGE